MLIRMVCAIKEKTLKSDLEKKLSDLDVQLKFHGGQKASWQDLVRSCADIFIISRSLIPKPIESSVAILNSLPEKPVTVILHDRESSEDHANLLAAGADVVLYTGIPLGSMVEAIESTVESRRQVSFADRLDHRGIFQPRVTDFVSKSEEMQVFLEEVMQIIPSDSNLLILGETGVGKEHLSRAIHAESNRSSGPFVAINMAAIPEQLMESELFGHEQGSFTGAVRSRRGAFEMAHGGTLFLDEIGETPLNMQTKLLRVLQDFEFIPVGGETPVWVDVRIIAATNKRLEQEVENGNFRQDLYYRLSVIPLTLPPLRQRREDIPALSNHFLNIYSKKMGREIHGISQEAMEALCRYPWPGNIRELMNVLERAVLLCKSNAIEPNDLPHIFKQDNFNPSAQFEFNETELGTWKDKTLSQVKEEVFSRVEKKYLVMILEKTGGKIGKAAEIAGIHPRGLYGKMKKLGLDKADFKTGKK